MCREEEEGKEREWQGEVRVGKERQSVLFAMKITERHLCGHGHTHAHMQADPVEFASLSSSSHQHTA